MRQEWEPEALIDCWTLVEGDWRLVGNKSGPSRLAFALMLKFYEVEGRFPAGPEEIPVPAVEYMAALVKVSPAAFATYSWASRTTEYHRAQIRREFGTRPAGEADEERWAEWLAAEVCPVETTRRRLAAALRQRCRTERIEPPAEGQVERVVASSLRRFEVAFAATVATRLGPAACTRLEGLLGQEGLLAALKADPGPLGLDTLLAEVGKLTTVRAVGLPVDLFADSSDRIVAAWRARAARMFPSDFAECGEPVRYVLLAALCWLRQSEITDGLVELLTGLIHRIGARAERRVEKELIGELVNVPGKRGIFTRLVAAAVEHPDDTVREALYPVVPGGEKTLRDLARELMATERVVAERVRYQLRGSYSHHYRRMLAPLLTTLRFRCHNRDYRPVMDAVELLARYTDADRAQRFYPAGEQVPVAGVVPKAWQDAVTDQVSGRIERIPYELCVLIALREALRRREIYVEGAGRWRDPDEDLPGDFDDNRDVHYAELGKPLDAAAFIADLQARHRDALDRLDAAMATGTTGGVRIITRGGQPWAQASHLPGVAGTGPRRPHHLRLRLPGFGTAATGDPRRAAGRGELEQRQHRRLLRQGFRAHRRRPRARRGLHACPAPAPVGAGARQHLAAAKRARRPTMGGSPDRGGPARSQPAVLVPRQPLRPVPPRHDQTPRSAPGRGVTSSGVR